VARIWALLCHDHYDTFAPAWLALGPIRDQTPKKEVPLKTDKPALSPNKLATRDSNLNKIFRGSSVFCSMDSPGTPSQIFGRKCRARYKSTYPTNGNTKMGPTHASVSMLFFSTGPHFPLHVVKFKASPGGKRVVVIPLQWVPNDITL